MVEREGSFVPVYDRPPSAHFFTVRMVTGGDITRHRDAMNMPLYWLLSYADAKIKENTPEDEDKQQNDNDIPEWVREWNENL